MRILKFTILCLMLSLGLSVQAKSTGIKVLAKSFFVVSTPPQTQLDKKTNKDAVVWYVKLPNWEDKVQWVENVSTETEENMIYPFPLLKGGQGFPKGAQGAFLGWILTEEGNSTILHCYLKMPADEITNLDFASEETAIVDMNSGIQYRANRVDPNIFGKPLGIRGKKGEYIDLKIYFPKLPENVHEIAIYGVRNWYLEGGKNTYIIQRNTQLSYDSKPEFHIPEMLRAESNYDRSNWDTWAKYNKAHLVKPIQDETMALWLTPEAAYLAIACEQNWTTEYFCFYSGTMLMDENYVQYKLQNVEGLPMDRAFFIQGNSGDHIAFLLKFDPMPLSTSKITYYAPASQEAITVWGANNEANVKPNLSVEKLRKNQQLFKYQKRIIVK